MKLEKLGLSCTGSIKALIPIVGINMMWKPGLKLNKVSDKIMSSSKRFVNLCAGPSSYLAAINLPMVCLMAGDKKRENLRMSILA